ncbi:MAG: hypothetical protein ACYDEJ_08925 [Desulfitobacteriaceae bacterium]
MRKMNWFVAILTLGLGITVGMLGFSVANPTSAEALLTKLRGKTNVQTLASVSQGSSQGLDESNKSNVGTEVNKPATALAPSGDQLNSSTQGINVEIPPQLAQQIITDYKQDVGILFDAWKCTEMSAFRAKLATGYTGGILEKHANRAEPYLLQGVGLDVIKIDFDQVIVEKADKSTATLRADYQYTAADYSFENASSVGEAHEQKIHVRVNLINLNSRWLITGESSI